MSHLEQTQNVVINHTITMKSHAKSLNIKLSSSKQSVPCTKHKDPTTIINITHITWWNEIIQQKKTTKKNVKSNSKIDWSCVTWHVIVSPHTC